MKQTSFHFYAELNDFLAEEQRFHPLSYSFNGNPAIKDSLEAVGVPHTEVNVIVVNGTSVDFSYPLQDGDSVSIYPASKSAGVSPVIKLGAKPLPEARFVLDVHLGTLANKLRMLGFDTLYRNDYDDPEIVDISVKENRIILTRDRGILMYKVVLHGYWIRSMDVDEQLTEVLEHYQLYSKVRAFHRCILCNGILNRMDKRDVMDRLQPRTAMYFNEFFVCSDCNQVYWRGEHYQKMKGYIQNLLKRENKQG